MIDVEEYKKYYREKIESKLNQTENKRLEYIRSLRTIMIIMSVIFAIIVAIAMAVQISYMNEPKSYYSYENPIVSLFGFILALIFMAIFNPYGIGFLLIITAIIYSYQKSYQSIFKDSVIEPTTKYIDERFIYHDVYKADTNIKNAILDKYNIFKFFFKIKTQDKFTMNSDDESENNFNFFKIKIKPRIIIQYIIFIILGTIGVNIIDNSSIDDIRIHIFSFRYYIDTIYLYIAVLIVAFILFNAYIKMRGLFFTMDFNKYFEGKTEIVANNNINIIDNKISNLQKVRIEDPIFEKYFNVYSNNQVEARYILSTSLIERLNEFAKLVSINKNFKLSFKNNKMYLKLSFKKDLFEPKLFKTVYDEESAIEYYKSIVLSLEIIKQLGLDRRLWLKE